MKENLKEKTDKKRNYLTQSSFELEKTLIIQGYNFIIGIDEAGRGPLAGPVVACAAVCKFYPEFILGSQDKKEMLKQAQHDNGQIQDDKMLDLIRDSKTLSEKQRESLFDFISENFHIGVGICDHHTIDRINILEASFLVMKSAITQLKINITKCHSRENGNLVLHLFDSALNSRFHGNDNKTIILLDGNKQIPNISIEQKCIVGGDKLVKSISAASIIAKVTRDRIMKEMHEKYPEYNFVQHKGYGTASHIQALGKYGPCEIHRKSFGPVRKLKIFDKNFK